MSKCSLACITIAAGLTIASPALAQTTGSDSSGASGPMTSDEAVAQANGTPLASSSSRPLTVAIAANEEDRRRLLLYHDGQEYSAGWRTWVMWVPSGIVGMFVHLEPGWAGGLNIATGPEFVYRNHGMDIALAAMYVGYGAPAGFFRGSTEPPVATERIESRLFGVYLTSHFMWSVRFHPMFEFQAGAGIGVGYVGGALYRTQAYPGGSGGSWMECQSAATEPTAYCGNPNNNHYPNAQGVTNDNMNRYQEPNWFGGGSVPSVIPWLSIPQIAFHVRPHRNFDFKIEGGFAVIGLYGGASLHAVF